MNAKLIEATIAAYIESNLLQGVSGPLAYDVSLVDLGVLDSMAVAALLSFAEAEFGFVLDETGIPIESLESVNAVAALVRRKLGRECLIGV